MTLLLCAPPRCVIFHSRTINTTAERLAINTAVRGINQKKHGKSTVPFRTKHHTTSTALCCALCAIYTMETFVRLAHMLTCCAPTALPFPLFYSRPRQAHKRPAVQADLTTWIRVHSQPKTQSITVGMRRSARCEVCDEDRGQKNRQQKTTLRTNHIIGDSPIHCAVVLIVQWCLVCCACDVWRRDGKNDPRGHAEVLIALPVARPDPICQLREKLVCSRLNNPTTISSKHLCRVGGERCCTCELTALVSTNVRTRTKRRKKRIPMSC